MCRPGNRWRIEDGAVPQPIDRHKFGTAVRGGDPCAIVERHFGIVPGMDDQRRPVCLREKAPTRERRDRTPGQALEPPLEASLSTRVETSLRTEPPCDILEPIRRRHENEADKIRLPVHRRQSTGRDEKRQRTDRVPERNLERTERGGHVGNGARTIEKTGTCPLAVAVRRQVHQDGTKSTASEEIRRRTHERGLTRPTMHQEHTRAGPWLCRSERIGLDRTGDGRHQQPLRRPQMKARPLDQKVMVRRAM